MDTARVHVLPSGTQQFCNRLAWATCSIWEYTDHQRLIDTLGRYGPQAFIIPATGLNVDGPTFMAAATSDMLVGAIRVDAAPGTPLPSTYGDLGLWPGNNCVYLRNVSGVLQGFVNREAATGPPCPPTASGTQLKVYAVRAPGPLAGAGNLAPVARFHEGHRPGRPGHVSGLPYFGLRCGDHWCKFLPATLDSLPLPYASVAPSPGAPDARPWLVHGWQDVQHLSEYTPSGLVRSGIRASIVPVRQLGAFTIAANFSRRWTRVATIRIHDDIPPSSKYSTKWGYVVGHNELWIKSDASGTKWEGEIRNRAGRNAVPVDRYAHAHVVPATARFWWYERDEGGWVRCENGCCRVGGT